MNEQVTAYLEEHHDRFLEELKDLLRIPSISADSKYANDVRLGAQFIHQQLESMGCDTELVETAGHPIVYGEWLKAEGAPTVLVYGHYDVQPPDPLDEWISPPFEPTIRDEHIYARGATDDKGQMFTHVKSVEAWLKTVGELPVNVKFVIEGEEEVGGENLDEFLKNNQDRCRADVAVVSDTAQYGPGIPAITYGLRGIVACEIHLQGPSQDLHSGVFGGAVANPVNVLARLIASLHDDAGHCQIPGFYDDVVPLTDEERQNFAALPFDDAEFAQSLGISGTFGEAGYSTLERRWGRPTCDVNGITGGYQGEGPKTIVPAKASAKITCRLVPNQNADAILASLESYLRGQLPPGIQLTFRRFHGCPAVVCDLNSPYMAAARRAVAVGFGKEPVLIREGGSIPVVGSFKEFLGIDTLLLGWGQNTDNLHSPNEKFSLSAFRQGILASAALWHELANNS
ncbi:MAG: dipeptidase [Planctomycetaceae bacterium]|nr:dipeptidase [Planctomycetaceae bacterium]